MRISLFPQKRDVGPEDPALRLRRMSHPVGAPEDGVGPRKKQQIPPFRFAPVGMTMSEVVSHPLLCSDGVPDWWRYGLWWFHISKARCDAPNTSTYALRRMGSSPGDPFVTRLASVDRWIANTSHFPSDIPVGYQTSPVLLTSKSIY